MRLGDDGAPRVLLIRDSYRNWGFPKGHLERGERPDAAAMREVSEETGLRGLVLVAKLQTIDWHFRFRGRPIHKTCHFYLMRTAQRRTRPQADEGITACRWLPFDEAETLISYANAREVLQSARTLWDAETPVVPATDGSGGAARVNVHVEASDGTGESSAPASGAAPDAAAKSDEAPGQRARARRRNRRRRGRRRRRRGANPSPPQAPSREAGDTPPPSEPGPAPGGAT